MSITAKAIAGTIAILAVVQIPVSGWLGGLFMLGGIALIGAAMASEKAQP